MEDILIILIVTVIVIFVGLYIYKAKKSGKKCIGCPEADACGKKRKAACNCSCSGCSLYNK